MPRLDVSRLDTPRAKRLNKKAAAEKRASTRGASRSKPKAEPGKSKSYFRMVFFSASFVAMFCSLGYFVAHTDWQIHVDRLQALITRPIDEVIIDGDFRFLDKQAMYALVQAQGENSFVNMDIKKIKVQMETMPWVESVNISRVWPAGMLLKVKEQKPIARWGNEGFINQFGEIVKTQQIEDLIGLPVLYGDENAGQEITKMYMEVAEMLSGKSVSLRGLQMDAMRSWTLILNENMQLLLGREDVLDRLRNFLYVYQLKLKYRESEIEKIDMRYESGLAVQWKPAETQVVNTAQGYF